MYAYMEMELQSIEITILCKVYNPESCIDRHMDKQLQKYLLNLLSEKYQDKSNFVNRHVTSFADSKKH
jgi:hypothetical protein